MSPRPLSDFPGCVLSFETSGLESINAFTAKLAFKILAHWARVDLGVVALVTRLLGTEHRVVARMLAETQNPGAKRAMVLAVADERLPESDAGIVRFHISRLGSVNKTRNDLAHNIWGHARQPDGQRGRRLPRRALVGVDPVHVAQVQGEWQANFESLRLFALVEDLRAKLEGTAFERAKNAPITPTPPLSDVEHDLVDVYSEVELRREVCLALLACATVDALGEMTGPPHVAGPARTWLAKDFLWTQRTWIDSQARGSAPLFPRGWRPPGQKRQR